MLDTCACGPTPYAGQNCGRRNFGDNRSSRTLILNCLLSCPVDLGAFALTGSQEPTTTCHGPAHVQKRRRSEDVRVEPTLARSRLSVCATPTGTQVCSAFTKTTDVCVAVCPTSRAHVCELFAWSRLDSASQKCGEGQRQEQGREMIACAGCGHRSRCDQATTRLKCGKICPKK